MIQRSTVTAVLALAAAVTLTLGTATPAAATSGPDYVALGDSSASGVGAIGQVGWCLRSAAGYPGLFAARNNVSSFRFPACAGVTTQEMRDTQLGTLSRATDLVSVTVGGNDVRFAPTMSACVFDDYDACTAALGESRRLIRDELPAALDAAFADIAERAPNARVVVLGYGVQFDEERAVCGIDGLTRAERRELNAGAEHLNETLRNRTAAAGFVFADVKAAFEGHGVCSAWPWVHGLELVQVGNSFHPNTSGYRYGYLPALEAAAG